MLLKKLFKKPQTDVKLDMLNIRIPGLLISRLIFKYFFFTLENKQCSGLVRIAFGIDLTTGKPERSEPEQLYTSKSNLYNFFTNFDD